MWTMEGCHGCTVFTPVHSVDMADVSKSNIAERNDDLENVPHMNHAQHKHGKYAVNVVGEGRVHVSTEDVR
jgi:hypothetical protein